METDTDGFFPIVKTKFGIYKGAYEGINLVKAERIRKKNLNPIFICNGMIDCYEMEFKWLGSKHFIDFPSVVKAQTPHSILKKGANCYFIKYPEFLIYEEERIDDGPYPRPTIMAKVYYYKYEEGRAKKKNPIYVDITSKEEKQEEKTETENPAYDAIKDEIVGSYQGEEVISEEVEQTKDEQENGSQISIEDFLGSKIMTDEEVENTLNPEDVALEDESAEDEKQDVEQKQEEKDAEITEMNK